MLLSNQLIDITRYSSVFIGLPAISRLWGYNGSGEFH